MGKRRTLEKINQTLRILITGKFCYLGSRIELSPFENSHQVVLGYRTRQSTLNWLSRSEVVKLIWDHKGAMTETYRNVDDVINAAGMDAQKTVLKIL